MKEYYLPYEHEEDNGVYIVRSRTIVPRVASALRKRGYSVFVYGNKIEVVNGNDTTSTAYTYTFDDISASSFGELTEKFKEYASKAVEEIVQKVEEAKCPVCYGKGKVPMDSIGKEHKMLLEIRKLAYEFWRDGDCVLLASKILDIFGGVP